MHTASIGVELVCNCDNLFVLRCTQFMSSVTSFKMCYSILFEFIYHLINYAYVVGLRLSKVIKINKV